MRAPGQGMRGHQRVIAIESDDREIGYCGSAFLCRHHGHAFALAGVPPDGGVDAATASTRARLRELGMRDALIEGKAALLGLLFGPRFFEDPFKSWAGLGAEAAVTAAWRLVIE